MADSERFEEFFIMRPLKNSIKIGLWGRLIRNLRLLLPLVRDYWKGTYRDVTGKSIIIFIALVLYLIIPFDLIPDYIPGLGQIDDAAVLAFCLFGLEKDLLKYQDWKGRTSSA